ncbi:MAG: DUF1116 domain-containing protein [Azospirillum sp.]|nr:DUF1116 domain-containing protein [Azospirillum sp.]MCZ8124345.1 DUF1116 domain-containing protein [Magnetospirillum sp.]
MVSLLGARPRIVNIGLEGFARDLARAGAAVAHVEWAPPARGDARLAAVLAKLDADAAIEAANREALGRFLKAEPVLIDVVRADSVLPGLGERTILHAGPPIEWARMCGPLRGAIQGAIVLEGWAPDLQSAEKLAASGGVEFAPNHERGAVGPMTGMITRSMPVLVVENRAFGNRAYCTLNEGLGKVMRFGGNDESVLARLRWLASDLGPSLAAALKLSGGLALKPLIARGLAMGDEMHQRNVACTSLFVRAMAPWLARAVPDAEKLAKLLEFCGGNDQFFLNVAMAMGKAIADPAKGIARSTIVTAMCRNGTDFGIRVAGAGERWFVAPVEQPKGLYFPGYTEADANPDIGDSAIVETVGLGGFAMAASPAVAGFVGAGSAAEALDITRAMVDIAVGRNSDWTIPGLDFAGVPVGIDVRRVVETGIAPLINTGIAHRKPGIGQVGAGTVRAPLACFERALEALAEDA